MTKQKTRVPRDKVKFNLWYRNMKNNLPPVGVRIGVSLAESARVVNDSTAWDYLMLRNEIVRSYKGEESAVKKAVYGGDTSDGSLTLPTLVLPEPPDGIVFNRDIWDWANRLVQRIVKHDGCTPEIEALLDIELKDDDDVSPDELKQTIKEASPLNGGHVKIRCSLMGKRAYRVLSQRGENEAFEAIGDSTLTEFVDERPNLVLGQPEKRQYKTICIEGNKPVGDYSATETVITKP